MSAYLLARQDKSLAAPYFPGVQRPFPPLLSWDFMDQLVSLAWMQSRAQGALQHSQPADSCHTSVQNQPQTTAPAWTDRWIYLERALVILGPSKPQAGVYTPLGAPVQFSRCFRMVNSKRHRSSKTSAQQEQEHVHFQGWCVGSREPKGSRAPSPPSAVPGRLPTTGCLNRGGC